MRRRELRMLLSLPLCATRSRPRIVARCIEKPTAMSSNYPRPILLLLEKLNVPLQLLDRAVLLLDQRLLSLINLLLLQLRSN